MISKYLALDVGRARIGLAVANSIARLAAPMPALANDEQCLEELKRITAEEAISTLIVGLPRGLEGQETEQTGYVREFIVTLEDALKLPVVLQDEAVTSVKAEAELRSRKKQTHDKGDIDSLSAVYILEDYLAQEVQ